MEVAKIKKILCIVLAVLLLCIYHFSLAEENDPIVGLWYILYSKENTPPSIWDVFNFEYDRMVVIFDCQPDGEVFLYDILINDSVGKQEVELFAKWEKDSDDYTINMLGSDKFKAFFKDEYLYFDLYRSEMYLKLRKVEAFDWFDDLIR